LSEADFDTMWPTDLPCLKLYLTVPANTEIRHRTEG